MTGDGLVTAREAAKLLGVSKCTVYRWLKRGWIVGITLPNGTKRIPRVSIERMLAGAK
jgi:excisionase family DNA binding protein